MILTLLTMYKVIKTRLTLWVCVNEVPERVSDLTKCANQLPEWVSDLTKRVNELPEQTEGVTLCNARTNYQSEQSKWPTANAWMNYQSDQSEWPSATREQTTRANRVSDLLQRVNELPERTEWVTLCNAQTNYKSKQSKWPSANAWTNYQSEQSEWPFATRERTTRANRVSDLLQRVNGAGVTKSLAWPFLLVKVNVELDFQVIFLNPF